MIFSRNRKETPRSRWSTLMVAAMASSAVLASGCAYHDPEPITEGKVFAGGVEASAHTLTEGREAYIQYCYACHGMKGDGKGPSSYGLRPPPRDFTAGIFKFARIRSSDELPNDEDLIRIVKGGLHGTPMLAWDIPDVELRKIIQYVKTFAPQKWEKKKKSGEPVKTLEPFAPEADPWVGKEAEALQSGKELYHLRAECLNCHPSYLGKEDLYKLSVDAATRDPDKYKAISGYRSDPNGSVAKDSPEYGVKIMPPDFTFHPVRSATSADPTQDLYRIISFGVYPIMPAWRGAGLSEADIWALAHYVRSLMDLRGKAEGDALKVTFSAQANFEVPPPPPPPPPPEEATEGEGDKAGDAKAGDAKEKAEKKK